MQLPEPVKTPEQLKREGQAFLDQAVSYIMALQIAGKAPV